MGARALLLASPPGVGREIFAAQGLLYPGCGSLGELVTGPENPGDKVGRGENSPDPAFFSD